MTADDSPAVDTDPVNTTTSQPQMKCLWDGGRSERAACGVGFLVNVHGQASHQVRHRSIANAHHHLLSMQLLRSAETMSRRMEHRGACSCDNLTGDG